MTNSPVTYMGQTWANVKITESQQKAIQEIIQLYPELGYKSVGDFVADSIRQRIEEINKYKADKVLD